MKKLNNEELDKVSGGAYDNVDYIECNNCHKEFNADKADQRKVGSGCDAYYEYKCPHCDTWTKR